MSAAVKHRDLAIDGEVFRVVTIPFWECPVCHVLVSNPEQEMAFHRGLRAMVDEFRESDH